MLHEHLDFNGALLDQNLFSDSTAKMHIDAFLNKTKFEIKVCEYSDPVLKKSCPKCSNMPLKRHFDGKDISIIPIYECPACTNRAIFLTDKYLSKLINNNKELFDQKEIDELSKNSDYFMSELKEYIIRIFASKKIFSIR